MVMCAAAAALQSGVTLDRLLGVDELAELLNCCCRTVRRLCDAGKLPRPLRVGKLLRWPPNTIKAWVDGGCRSCRKEVAQ